MTWVVKGEDLIKFMTSPAFKEIERKIEEIGRIFESADEDTRKECWKILDGLAQLDQERDLAEERELAEEADFEEAQEEETRKFAENFPRWFPNLASKSQPELIKYAHALMSYHLRKKETN